MNGGNYCRPRWRYTLTKRHIEIHEVFVYFTLMLSPIGVKINLESKKLKNQSLLVYSTRLEF